MILRPSSQIVTVFVAMFSIVNSAAMSATGGASASASPLSTGHTASAASSFAIVTGAPSASAVATKLTIARQSTPAPAGSLDPNIHRAASAWSLYNVAGIDWHPDHGGNESSNYPALEKLVCGLGVRHARSGMLNSFSPRVAGFEMKVYRDCGVDDTLGSTPTMSMETMLQYKQFFGSAAIGFEGFNEPDNGGQGTKNLEATLMQQRMLWNAVHDGTHPEFAGMFVEGPSWLSCPGTEAFGDRSTILDYPNLHIYGPHEPESLGWGPQHCGSVHGYGSKDQRIAIAVQKMPQKKTFVLTETGYCSAHVDGCLPDNVSVSYTPRIFTSAFLYQNNLGSMFRLIMLYQILSENLNDADHSYGLVNPDYTPKPVYYAVQGFVSRIKDSPSTPRSIAYTLAGSDTDTQVLPLSFSDGSSGIVIYSKKPIFNPFDKSCDVEGCPVVVEPTKVTLAIGGTSATLSTEHPDGTWSDVTLPTAKLAEGMGLRLNVTAYPQIVRWRS